MIVLLGSYSYSYSLRAAYYTSHIARMPRVQLVR